MRKVEAAALASLEDYRLVEVDAPRPGAGEVLVRVAPAGSATSTRWSRSGDTR